MHAAGLMQPPPTRSADRTRTPGGSDSATRDGITSRFPRADVLQQPHTRVFYHVTHELETFRPAVVRVRHIVHVIRIGVIQQMLDASCGLATTELLDIAAVFGVHHDDVVETIEVRTLQLARTAHEFDAPAARRFPRTTVRQLADVVIRCARRIDFDAVSQTRPLDQVLEKSLRQRRTTDVAETNEDDRHTLALFGVLARSPGFCHPS